MVEPPMMDPDFLEGFDTREQEKIWRELATQDAAAGRAAKPAPAAEKKPDNVLVKKKLKNKCMMEREKE